MPGYVLAKLEMNDDVYHLVKNTPKVTGFLGPGGKPQPIPDAQAARMLGTKEEAAAHGAKQKINVDYEIGDRSRSSTAPSPASTAWSRSSTSTAAGQGQRLDLRPRDAGRARVRAGRTGQVSALPRRESGARCLARDRSSRRAVLAELLDSPPPPERETDRLPLRDFVFAPAAHLICCAVVLRIDVGDPNGPSPLPGVVAGAGA